MAHVNNRTIQVVDTLGCRFLIASIQLNIHETFCCLNFVKQCIVLVADDDIDVVFNNYITNAIYTVKPV